MILGIGADIVEIKRIQNVLKKTPAFLKRVFTPKEIAIGKKLSETKKYAYYAKRFAAKEAISKACGTGIGKKISWQDIEITNDLSGAPKANLSTDGASLLQKKFKAKNIRLFLSLSDEKNVAIALAILEKNNFS